MKNLFWIISVFIFFSSCSDFSHAQYKKVKKVPAVGDYHAIVSVQKKNSSTFYSFPENKISKKTELPIVENKLLVNQKIKSEIKTKSKKEQIELRAIFHKNSCVNKVAAIKKKAVVAKDHRKLVIFLLLLLGIALFSYGVFFIALAFSGIGWPFFLLGVAFVFLGLLPFAGLISMLVGDRANQEGKQFKDK